MSFASKYSKGGVKFDVDTVNFKYKDLKDLYKENGEDRIYKIMGFYINTKSKFGAAPVAICEGFFANMPSHELDEVKGMLADPETVADIKAGVCAFKIETYISKKGTTCYGVKWVDL